MKHPAIAILLPFLLALSPLAGAAADTDTASDSSDDHYTYTLTLLGEPVDFSLPAPSGEWLQQALKHEAEQSSAATAKAAD